MNEAQRKFVHDLVARFGIIEVNLATSQWRVGLRCMQLMKIYLLEYDGYDTAKRIIELYSEKASHEERIVMQSFLMEYMVRNFDNVKIPEILDVDLKDSIELIDYLITESHESK